MCLFLTEFKEAVAKAKSEVVNIKVHKVVFLGPPEAGKTQLARALVGDYREVTESTPVSTGAKVVVQRYVKNADATWEPLSKSVFQQSMHTTASLLMKKDDGPLSSQQGSDEVKKASDKRELRKVHSKASTLESGVVSRIPSKYPMGSHGDSVHKQDKNMSDSHSETASELSNEEIFHRLLMDVENSCEAYDKDRTLDVCYIHMIDNGGQPAFFDAHPVFATSPATYLLVYDMHMQGGLHGMPQYTYRKKEKEYLPIPNKNDTNLDIIKASLMTVISLREKFEQQRSSFLVVGTHYMSPLCEEDVEKQEKDLCDDCSSLYPAWQDARDCSMFPSGETAKLFPVDSLNEKCQGLKIIREEVISQGCSLEKDIPIKWFHCHLLFWHAKEAKTESGKKMYPGFELLKCSALYELCHQNDLIHDEKELLKMVRAFHALGLFFFPALDEKQDADWRTLNDQPVFTNPDLLYGELTKILEVAFNSPLRSPNQSNHIKWLKQDGELTPKAMADLNIPDTSGYMSDHEFRLYLLQQLSRWGLAAEIPSEDTRSGDKPAYFIPCVLKPSSMVGDRDRQSLAVFLTLYQPKPRKLYFLPNGVFTHFVVNLLNMHNKYTRRNNLGDEVYCYRDSIELIRHAQKEGDGVKCKYFLTLAISKKWKSITACIMPTRANENNMVPGDCQIVIWEELTVALEKASMDMYHDDKLTATVATECRCGKSGSHLAELSADKMNLSCLLGEEEISLPQEEELLINVLKAQREGMYVLCSCLLNYSGCIILAIYFVGVSFMTNVFCVCVHEPDTCDKVRHK